MSLSRGDKGPEVTALQKFLKQAGFPPGPIDGIFGDRTAEALQNYQQYNELPITGVLDDETMEFMDWASQYEEEAPVWDEPTGDGDYTSDDDTRFNGLGGHPEIWKDTSTGISYVVYFPEGQEPPIPVLFAIPSQDDLESFFGDKPVAYDEQFTTEDLDSFGAIRFGTTDNIPDKESDPLAGFADRMERAMEVMPWIADPEIYALMMGAYIEDRDLEEWELATTDYWQGLNDAERAWLSLTYSDPSEAESVREAAEIQVMRDFRELGMDVPDELVEFLANKSITGRWSEEVYQEQIIALSSGRMRDMKGGLKKFLEKNEISLDPSENATNQIRTLWDQWLGPAFAPTDAQVDRWAAEWRTAPEATKDKLQNVLRRRRLALFPEYTDENSTYQDIAGPWRNFASEVWGELPDEKDPTFLEVVRMNDAMEAGKLLRKTGLRQGKSGVLESLTDELWDVTGGGVRRAI